LFRRTRVYPTCENANNIQNSEYLAGLRAIKAHKYADGIEKFKLAAEAGIVEAHSRIFDIWKVGVMGCVDQMQRYLIASKSDRAREVIFGITPNHALKNLTTAADLGDRYAIGWLGLVYDGVCMDCKNGKLAEQSYRLASQRGCVHSAFNLLSGINEGVFEFRNTDEVMALTNTIMDHSERLPKFLNHHDFRFSE
jgi:hypothetical protein